MNDQEKAIFNEAQQAGKSSQRTASKKNQQADSGSQETFINIDLTADFESGIELVNARVKAFGAGVNYRMAQVQGAMSSFTGAKFVIADAAYQRPALPPSEEEVKQSVMALIYTPSTSEEVA
jgi:hypothetical protein